MDKDLEHIIEESKRGIGTVEQDGLQFAVMYSHSSMDIDLTMGYDAVIIEATDIEYTRHVVKRFRSHNNPEFYLKPVFLFQGEANKDPYINELVDGVIFTMEQVKHVISHVKKIFTRTTDLQFTRSISYEAQMIVKLISFMYTRDIHKLEPIPYFNSGIGYSYPVLSVNFKVRDEHNALKILKIAEEEGIIEGDFYERIHLCSKCHGGYLSYREVCPRCDSSNSETQDIIHHFPCGYVGPIMDFENELDDQLDCPKCSKRLRHIGVDYDKPSVLHTCNNCGHRYQDFNVKAKCLTCMHDNNVEALVVRELKNYELTKKGEVVAVEGFISTSKDIEEIIGTVKIETFKTMLKYEIERIRQTDGKSNIAALHITKAGEIYSKIGSDTQKTLLKDVVDVIRQNIRSSDMISFYDASTVLISLNELPTKVADNIVQEIIQLLHALLKRNFSDLDIDIRYNIHRLNYQLSHELQVQQLVKELFS